jgi:hypothetical protein
MSDPTALHRRWHRWPSPGFVLGLALTASKGFGLRSRPARPSAPSDKRHTAVESLI